MEANVDGQKDVKGDEKGKTKEVLVAGAALRRDSVMLEEQDPEAVPEGTEPEHLVLAGGARFQQGQLQTLHSIVGEVEGTLRFVNDLHLLGGATIAVDEHFGGLHVGLG